MRKILIIFYLFICLSGYSQSWVSHNDSLFMKRGNDSIYYNQYTFFDHFMRLKTEVEAVTTGRQPVLVSGTNIRTINGQPILGSGDIVIAAGLTAWGTITGVLSSQTDLQTALNGKLATNGNGSALTGLTASQVGLGNVTNNSAVANLSGTNTGDNAVNTLYSGLVGNANHTGDATGATALTLATVNGNVGSFGSATQAGTFTVNAKGLITAASNTTIQIPQAQVTNLVADLALKAPLTSAALITPTFSAGTIGIPVYARVTGSNATTTGQALVDITGLTVALAINAVYEFEANLSVSTTAVTTGTQYGINYSVAAGTIEAQIVGSLTTASAKVERISALNTASSAYLTTSAQTGGVRITGIVTTGANAGNLTVRHLKVTSGTSTVFINSFLKVTRIL